MGETSLLTSRDCLSRLSPACTSDELMPRLPESCACEVFPHGRSLRRIRRSWVLSTFSVRSRFANSEWKIWRQCGERGPAPGDEFVPLVWEEPLMGVRIAEILPMMWPAPWDLQFERGADCGPDWDGMDSSSGEAFAVRWVGAGSAANRPSRGDKFHTKQC